MTNAVSAPALPKALIAIAGAMDKNIYFVHMHRIKILFQLSSILCICKLNREVCCHMALAERKPFSKALPDIHRPG